MLKRTVDVVVAAVGLLLASPLMLVIPPAIKIDTRGPVFYRATRVGRGGKTFTMYKFRTMQHSSEHAALAITAHGDPRITKLGRLLRLTKLDEVPQLFNVLKGDMSLVGPRPEDPRFVARYTDEQRRVLSLRPGITGPTVLAYRHEERILASAPDPEEAYVHEVLPAKLALDLDYVENRSFAKDARILAQTLIAIFRRFKEKQTSDGQ